ncbi:hypothetical protein F5Y16DRAFT_232763 [Xylariaceae sp. FL0255]|nr:hypothetical protein F5Y16DRAFT_232763 [Xylariaceae sp. FL0255]
MKFSTIASASIALAGVAVAAPTKRAASTSAADIIGMIAPDSKTCAAGNSDCRTNVQAAPYLIAAMAQYGLKYPGQIAAVLSLTAYESDNYAYKHNISPGRPGQGTSNMQMINYNIEYANSIPALKSAVAGIAGGNPTTPEDENALLALVEPDEYNFGSGPWFLTTKCSPSVVTGLQNGTTAAFEDYMTCVGVSLTDDRKAYWTRAQQAFGLSG